MPSWNNFTSSTDSWQEHFTDMDYAPDTTEDLTFSGLATGSGLLCRVHNLEPVRCVAFEGGNTGRRFYMCQIGNEVINCGFVARHDVEEWPQTLQNSLAKLWGMYNESSKGRIEDRIQSAKLLEDLSVEKERLEKDYASLMNDVNKLFSDCEIKQRQANYRHLNKEKEEVEKLENELAEIKMEKDKLAEEVVMLKEVQKAEADVMKARQLDWEKETNAMKEEKIKLSGEVMLLKEVQKTQADVMRSRQQDWEKEREAMKEEKKRLEYMLFDLIKARDGDKAVVTSQD